MPSNTAVSGHITHPDHTSLTSRHWPHTSHPSLLSRPGHIYYFLEDVYPRMTGRRPLKTPGIVKALFPGEQVHTTDTTPMVAPGMVPPPEPPAPQPGYIAPEQRQGVPPAAAVAGAGVPAHAHQE